MAYQEFYNDRTNPYGKPNRKTNNLNEKSVYARHPDKGGKGDVICYSKDNKECTTVKTIYQYRIRSEAEAGPNRYANKFNTFEDSYLSGRDRLTLYGRAKSECQNACI